MRKTHAHPEHPDTGLSSRRRSLFEHRDNAFAEHIERAAYLGQLSNTGPLVECLNRAVRVARGLDMLFTLARNNAVEQHEDEQADDGNRALGPLSPATMDVLFDLGQTAAELLARDIGVVAAWTEENGLVEDGR
ncbi:hypothetical protein BKK81_01975 [Cupriavidus sp. USMAHM13]|uniref:hypothetical protein n=1 Tax=Cupriavidus sp. USMAHM13 TaxID=1389192 RepID=UPI0008A6867A|nr:hypothetical protein [Cupriavidus sp. USMAHM13]AOY98202.1 hypothetical protein BKK81_01975 [Cupriavidus sp. USMAHM13]